MKSSFLLYFFRFLSFFRFGRQRKRFFVLKIDAIGDYILFRNFLSELKSSPEYKDCDFYLLGNIQWKEIYEAYDSDFANQTFWFDRSKGKNHLYLFFLLIKLSFLSVDLLLQPTHSRDFWCDFFSKRIPSRKKVSSFGDDINIGRDAKLKSDQFFDTLVPVKFLYEFEFNRNREFFSHFLGREIQISKPEISFSKKYSEPYISVFLGASSPLKQFNKGNLFSFLKKLANNTKYKFKLLGAEKENHWLNDFPFSEYLNLENHCGKTNLVQLIDQIGNSSSVISYDSSGVHIAMATNVNKVICFSNGNHYDRFIPYPKDISPNMICFFPPAIQPQLNTPEMDEFLKRCYLSADLDINDISIDTSINRIFEFIES